MQIGFLAVVFHEGKKTIVLSNEKGGGNGKAFVARINLQTQTIHRVQAQCLDQALRFYTERILGKFEFRVFHHLFQD